MESQDSTKARKIPENDYERLESEFKKALSEKNLRTILAYKYWEDGSDFDFVKEVWKEDPYWSADNCREALKDKFGIII